MEHSTISSILLNSSIMFWNLEDLPQVLPMEQCHILHENNVSLLSNITCLKHAPVFTHSAAIRASVLTVMAVLSFLANVATIVSIHRNRKHRLSSVYRLILHLTIADLFVTFFCIGGEAAWNYTVAWLAGDVTCKLFKFIQMFSLYLSTFVLVLIGVDRFVAVRYPMKSLTAKYCNRFVAGAWIFSALCSVPQLVIFRVLRGPFYEEFYQCVTHGFYTEMWQEQLYGAFSLLLMFVLPLLVLVTTYVSTVFTIARSERLFKAEVESCSGNGVTSRLTPAPDLNRRRLMQRAKMKSLRISVVIVVAFVIWWTPYYVMMVYFMFIGPEQPPDNPDANESDQDADGETLRSAIFFFGMSNSLVNPLIYGAFHLWRPRPRASSYRSAAFNRDGSTRRSTATHVSLRRCDSRGTHVVVGAACRREPRSPVDQESTALVTLDCPPIVESRVSIPENEVNRLLITSPANKTKLPNIILRYGVLTKGTRSMQTRI